MLLNDEAMALSERETVQSTALPHQQQQNQDKDNSSF